MSFNKEQYDKETEEFFKKFGKQNFNEGLNKHNEEDAMSLCEHFNGMYYVPDTEKGIPISDDIDNYLPDDSNIDGTSKLDFMYRKTDRFPLKIQDKAYSRKYFLDRGVPDENLPKEYGVYESYKDFEKDIHTFEDKDIVIKYNLGADCEQVIRIKKSDIDEKKNKIKIKELFDKNGGGTDYVTGGHLKGAVKDYLLFRKTLHLVTKIFLMILNFGVLMESLHFVR